MNSRNRILILFLLQFILIASGYCQLPNKFHKVQVAGDVLPSIIYSIEQDSFGYIWAGTEEGVIRYNSKEVFLYDKYRGLPKGTSNRIKNIYIDKKNRIWAGMEKGLMYYNPDSNKFVYQNIKNNKKLNLIECLEAGDENTILIGDFNGLWQFDIDSAVLKNIYNGERVYSAAFSQEGILVGTVSGLIYVDKQNKKTTHIPFPGKNEDVNVSCIQQIDDKYYIGTVNHGLFILEKNMKDISAIELPVFSDVYFRINSILKIKDNLIVIGTDGAGLLYLDNKNRYLGSDVNNVNEPSSISSNGIYDLLLGKENILWIATYGGGINYTQLDDVNFTNITHVINNDNSLIYNSTRSIQEDSQGKIWFGTKQGLSIWDRKKDKWTNIHSFDKNIKVPDIILDLEEDGRYMWIATYRHGIFKMDKNSFTIIPFSKNKKTKREMQFSNIYSLLKDSKGNMWLGGISGNLHKIDTKGDITQYPVILIKDLLELNDGSILAVGRTGANIIKDEKVITIKELTPGNAELDYTNINCAKQNSKGNLILGTNGSGIIFYNFKNKNIKKINRKNGMPSDIIQAILMRNDTDIWVSTTRGLAHLLLGSKDTIINIYNKYDGLTSNEYNMKSAAKLSNGMFVFGGVDGVTMFDPAKIKMQKIVPTIVFENFKLFKKKDKDSDISDVNISNINTLKKLKLKYDENSFNIKFVGILHSSPSKVLYSWKMEGMNNIWSEPGTETQVNFANLPPGNYKFLIRASNRDGIWSPAKALSIAISKPWWKTPLAYFLYFLAFLSAIALLIYSMNLYLTKKNAEEQINFFNNITHELKTPLTILLSTIESLPKNKIIEYPGLKKIKSTSRQLVNLFEQLLNFHLISSGEQKSENLKEIPVSQYLNKVVNRFNPLLKEKEIDIQIINNWKNGDDYFYYDKYKLDKIIFNLLSNAIKYSKQGGEIKIVADRKKEHLVLSVIDDGIGIPKDQQKYILKRYYRGRNAINSNLPGTGLGLMIVKNLVERDNGTISFKSIENKGSTFTVKLPDKKQKFTENIKIKNSTFELSTTERELLDDYSDSKILIVEDNDELRKDLVEKLGKYFQVYEAENGKAGLETALKTFPDLIITDLIMPEMDGFELARALQKNINLNHIPIIMVTVLTGRKQKLESAASGISTYMEKPVDYNYLLAKIINILSWSKKMREKYLHEFDVGNALKFRTEKDAEFIENLEKFVLSKINDENLSVHDLCNFVKMSRTALYMKLKSLVDLSPQNFIIHTRLKFARKKLIEGKMSIKEVAYSSGFSNPKYFSTSFKKLFGVSPTTFIKNINKDVNK